MKKTLLVLALLTSIFLIAACTEQAPEGIETPTTNMPTATPSVCGDGECDSSEMCIIDALQSACPDDCGPCPPSVYVEPFSCDGSGCEKTGADEFTLKVPTAIKSSIAIIVAGCIAVPLSPVFLPLPYLNLNPPFLKGCPKTGLPATKS